ILLLSVAADHCRPRPLRAIAVAACIAPQVLLLILPSWELRSAVYYLIFMLLVGALAVRRVAGRISQECVPILSGGVSVVKQPMVSFVLTPEKSGLGQPGKSKAAAQGVNS